RCIVDPFDSTGRIRSQSNHVKWRLDDISRAQMDPILFRECVDTDHSVPIVQQRFCSLRMSLSVPGNKAIAFLLALRLSLGIIHRPQQLLCGGLFFLRQFVQYIANFVIPATLLAPLGMELSECCPNSKVAIRNG